MESELRIKQLEEENIRLKSDLKEYKDKRCDEEKEFYHSIINNINIPVYVVDVDESGKFTYKLSNSFNVALTGVPFEEVENQSPDVLLSHIGQEGVNAILHLFNSCVETRDTITFEIPFSFKNENRWYFNRITPLINNQGRIYRLVGTGLDITERKESEIKFAEINEQLEKEKEKAELSDKHKSAFLANVSHEVRTPMNGILGFVELLKDPSLSSETSLRYIELIEQGGNRMLAILNDLVDIAKIESGQTSLNISNLKIYDILKDIHDFFNLEAKNKKITLKYYNQNEGLTISTDKQKFQQIISNLVKNALKFTEYGSVEIGYEVNHDNIRVYVKDTGIGIDEKDIKKIFERFSQSNKNNNNTKEGIGLGLSICKAFAKLLDGDITVESTQGSGSTFSFVFPYRKIKNSDVPEIQISSTNEKKNNAIRVLIAEDDEICFYLLKEIFEHNNIRYERAGNGKEAVDILEKDSAFNCILMDVKMPVMNGIEATQIIKEKWNHIPIIVQSAYTSGLDITKAFEVGADDFIPKPISKKLLLEKINKVLSK